MKKQSQPASAPANRPAIEHTKTRIELAKTRRELAKTRREQAKTRTELAKTRTEQAKTRVELARTRKIKKEIGAHQVEKTLQRVVHKEFDRQQKKFSPSHRQVAADKSAGGKMPLENLTHRQCEILKFIAESHNTKQIAGLLKVSSKTVEYHRRKLMAAVKVHDIPGLVRIAVRAGLIAP